MQSTWKVLSTKIEIRLKKQDGHHWSALEGDGGDPLKRESSEKRQDSAFKSSKGRDWSRIEKDLEKVTSRKTFILNKTNTGPQTCSL